LPYFFNTETQQPVWEPPSELTPEKIEALPGAELLKVKEVSASYLLVKHTVAARADHRAEKSPISHAGHRDPAWLQSGNRDEHGKFWLARAQALGLYIA
jgi:hypothetical protein